MNNIRIAVLILNWNGLKYTIPCINSLLNQEYDNYRIVIVDNGSKDNDDLVLKKLFGNKIDIISNSKNYGYCKGNNIGIKYAIDVLKADYILLLNNDTIAAQQMLKEFVSFVFDKEKCVVQGKVLYPDESINSLGISMDRFGATKFIQKENDEPIFYCHGACMLIPRELVYDIGYFDDLLFAYHDDVDFCWRARLNGYDMFVVKKAICYHYENKALGSKSNMRDYWGIRNRLRVLMKNYSLLESLIIVPITLFILFIVSCYKAMQDKSFRFMLNYAKAILWNMRYLKDTNSKRRLIQRNRNLSFNSLKKYMYPTSIEYFFFRTTRRDV